MARGCWTKTFVEPPDISDPVRANGVVAAIDGNTDFGGIFDQDPLDQSIAAALNLHTARKNPAPYRP